MSRWVWNVSNCEPLVVSPFSPPIISAPYHTTRSCTCRRRRCPCITRHCARAVSFTILASSMLHTSKTCSSARSGSQCSSSSRTPPQAHSELLLHQRVPYYRVLQCARCGWLRWSSPLSFIWQINVQIVLWRIPTYLYILFYLNCGFICLSKYNWMLT